MLCVLLTGIGMVLQGTFSVEDASDAAASSLLSEALSSVSTVQAFNLQASCYMSYASAERERQTQTKRQMLIDSCAVAYTRVRLQQRLHGCIDVQSSLNRYYTTFIPHS